VRTNELCYNTPMKRTNIHLEDDQREWLKTEAKRLGVKPAALVRKLIEERRTLSGEGRKPAAKGG